MVLMEQLDRIYVVITLELVSRAQDEDKEA